jgi:cyclase
MKLLILSLFFPSLLMAQDFNKVQIKTIKISKNVHMLQGAGGNIGVLSGNDGVFIIDDQFAPLTKKIKAAISKISKKPIKYVFNTHWHFDHTGGNENLGKSGTVIVAHENVRKLLSKDQMLKVFGKELKASPKVALPVITFNSRINFHLNNEHLNIFHVENAHTNGDGIIHFKESNVFHMGDTFFKDKFPFIDVQHGGSLNGIILAAERVLAMSNPKTKFIPGHGDLADQNDLRNYIRTLKDVQLRLSKYKRKNLSLDRLLKKKPLEDLDKTYGAGFMKTDKWISIVYPTL